MTPLLDSLIGKLTGAPLHTVVPDQLRVVVVDDEESVLRFADRVLRHGGYRPLLASSGTEALVRVEALGGCDVLVTDLMMPEMTGEELACQMRRDLPDLKVLYLTGFADRLFAEKRVLWEGEAYLEKPSSITGLLEALSLLVYGSCAVPVETPPTLVPVTWS